MHELSLCQALLEQLERLAQEHHAVGIKRVVLRIGPLSGVNTRQLGEAFTIVRSGTVANAAELVTEQQPVEVECLDCGGKAIADPQHLVCPLCGSLRTELIRGDELLLASVELELS